MSDAVKIGFVPFSAAPRGVLVVFSRRSAEVWTSDGQNLGAAADLVKRAAETSRFKGKSGRRSISLRRPA